MITQFKGYEVDVIDCRVRVGVYLAVLRMWVWVVWYVRYLVYVSVSVSESPLLDAHPTQCTGYYLYSPSSYHPSSIHLSGHLVMYVSYIHYTILWTVSTSSTHALHCTALPDLHYLRRLRHADKLCAEGGSRLILLRTYVCILALNKVSSPSPTCWRTTNRRRPSDGVSCGEQPGGP